MLSSFYRAQRWPEWPLVRFSILLAVTVLMAGWLGACGGGSDSQPELPKSVAPGWTLGSYARASAPAGVPGSNGPVCWKAVYSGPGSVSVWVCGYKSAGGAFDAEQRMEPAAQRVKFQEGSRLVLVEYKDAKHVDLEALIRALQKKLKG